MVKKQKPVKAHTFVRNQDREEKAKKAAEVIQEELSITNLPQVALILGTGWGSALKLKDKKSLSFRKIPGFESLGDLTGHKRKVLYGQIDELPVIALSGRVHANEDLYSKDNLDMVRLQIEMLIQLGVHKFILTCAAGAIPTPGSRPSAVGDIIAIDGFLSVLSSFTPPLYAGEFYSADDVISEEFLSIAQSMDKKHSLNVKIGGYCYYRGPNFEGTKYDKRFIAMTGVSAVGMSTLPEAVVCSLYRDEGVEIIPIAFITNSDSEQHSHEENMARAKVKARYLGNFVSDLALKIAGQ